MTMVNKEGIFTQLWQLRKQNGKAQLAVRNPRLYLSVLLWKVTISVYVRTSG